MNILHYSLIGALLAVNACNTKPKPAADNTTAAADQGPAFTKEGELYFISHTSNDTISKIDIELATTDEERATGLMYRRQMDENQGMLFIFEAESQQSFYMKNTYIPLDLVYVNAQQEIVSVTKYATPMSEKSLPSYKEAMYVVEVNAGYIDRHKIAFGDKISFTRNK
ncbi:DUF192 domain-containing protein [Chitinophaga sedimenti]|uniref:DUF192 domain-containing protein n=1 Tax=Chitinophaga sedimenti TaxID=2033606 RepID=UPI002003B25F|nr:DUF192 domain-containing protein [Chitinophaga sedimenti]MCK7554486.1 DUF192 domain-containing protein [Chitinophaga sedimenti]